MDKIKKKPQRVKNKAEALITNYNMKKQDKFKKDISKALDTIERCIKENINVENEVEFGYLVEDLLALFAKEKEKTYQKGFIAGADATAIQKSELRIELIKEVKKIRKKSAYYYYGWSDLEDDLNSLIQLLKTKKGKE